MEYLTVFVLISIASCLGYEESDRGFTAERYLYTTDDGLLAPGTLRQGGLSADEYCTKYHFVTAV